MSLVEDFDFSFLKWLFLMLAILSIFGPTIARYTGVETKLPYFSMVLAFLSLAIACLSGEIAQKSLKLAKDSDKKMKSLANLNFVEKHAKLQQYINEFKHQNFDNIRRCKLDLEAILEIKDWIASEKKEKLIKDVIKLIGGALSNQYYFDLERVKPLLKEILETSLKFNLKTNELNILKKHLMNLKQKPC